MPRACCTLYGGGVRQKIAQGLATSDPALADQSVTLKSSLEALRAQSRREDGDAQILHSGPE